MVTIKDDRGLINNFARDPEAYAAEAPSPEQKRRYAILGVVGAVFMTGVIALAVAVS